MNRTNWTKRLMVPMLLGLMAAVIGLSIQIRPTLGNSFPTADASRVAVSNIILPASPSGTLAVGIDGTTQTLTLSLQASAAAFFTNPVHTSGQALIYRYDPTAKDGVKIQRELVTYDNTSCAPTVTQLCITSRAQGGTAKVAHKAGSLIKLATQLTAAIDNAQLNIAVGSTDGFLSTANLALLIDSELVNVQKTNGTLFTAAANLAPTPTNPARGSRPAPNALTVPASHLIGAIVVRPDTFIISLTRQVHNMTDNTITINAKAYLLLQPAWPSIALTQPIPVGTIPFPYDTGASPLLYGYGLGDATNLIGTYNPSTGQINAAGGNCYIITAGTPPTTTVFAETLQFQKALGTQNVGTFGAVTDTTHSAFTTLATAIPATGMTLPSNIDVVDTTGFAASGQVMIGTPPSTTDSEIFTYDSITSGTQLHVTTRANGGGSAAAAHPAGTGTPVIQTPVCDQLATGGILHVETLAFGQNLPYDSDGDGCSNWNELGSNQTAGGRRDPFNHYDFFDPVPGASTKRQVLVPDILAVVQQYFVDDLPGPIDLTSATDRTALAGAGANTWNLGPPDGLQRVPDILAVVKQYFDSCANA